MGIPALKQPKVLIKPSVNGYDSTDPNGEKTKPPIDTLVFAVFGQSNAVGLAPIREGLDDDYTILDGRVQQFGYTYPVLKEAKNPMDNAGEPANSTGYWLGFAREVIQAKPSNYKIVFVMCAKSGTGFTNDEWNPGDPMYSKAVYGVNTAMGLLGSQAEFSGVLWAQGATDRNSSNYLTNLTNMYHSMVNDIDSMTNMTPFFAASIGANGDPLREGVDAKILQFTQNIPAAVYVDMEGIPTLTDGVHWTAEGLETAGKRFAAEYL